MQGLFHCPDVFKEVAIHAANPEFFIHIFGDGKHVAPHQQKDDADQDSTCRGESEFGTFVGARDDGQHDRTDGDAAGHGLFDEDVALHLGQHAVRQLHRFAHREIQNEQDDHAQSACEDEQNERGMKPVKRFCFRLATVLAGLDAPVWQCRARTNDQVFPIDANAAL